MKNLIFSLDLDVFSLDFIVDVELSAELTFRFNGNDNEFLFAAGEIWIKTATHRELVIPVKRPENLLQILEKIAKRVQESQSEVGLEKLILKGGWSLWMNEFHQRMVLDSTSAEDEMICDMLLPLSVVASSRSRIIFYSYSGCPVVEVIAYSEEETAGNIFWGEYDPVKVGHRIVTIKENMSNAIKTLVKDLS